MLSAAIFFTLLVSAIAQTEPPAIVVRPPAESTAIATQSVKFTCVAYGTPTPTVQWSTISGKNLSTMTGDGSSWVVITDTPVTTGGVTMLVSVLEFCNVDASFADTYTCWATNGVTGDGIVPSAASFALTVTQPITAPPTIVLGPPGTTQVNEAESVQVTCVAYGNPVPTIYWSKPGCLQMNNDTDNVYVFSDMITVNGITMRWSTLQICSAGADDATQYSCWADNGVKGTGLGASSFNFNVRVALRGNPTTDQTNTESQVLVVDDALPYIAVMSILLVLVIVLIIAVVLLGIYALRKNNLQPKSNYAVTMGAVNPGSEGYEISTPDDQQLIEDDIKHDLTLDAEDVGTDTQ